MYITDLLLWNSKHKSNNVMILEGTINEICNCKINTNVKIAKLSLRIPFKVMPLFSSRSFFQGSNEVVYVNVLGLSPLLLSGFRWCLLRSVCSGISLWWWRCLDVRVGPFFSFPWQASRLLVVRGPTEMVPCRFVFALNVLRIRVLTASLSL